MILKKKTNEESKNDNNLNKNKIPYINFVNESETEKTESDQKVVNISINLIIIFF